MVTVYQYGSCACSIVVIHPICCLSFPLPPPSSSPLSSSFSSFFPSFFILATTYNQSTSTARKPIEMIIICTQLPVSFRHSPHRVCTLETPQNKEVLWPLLHSSYNTPKQHTLQQLSLVVTKAYALLMRNAYGKVGGRPTPARQATPPQPPPRPPGINHPHSTTHIMCALVYALA